MPGIRSRLAVLGVLAVLATACGTASAAEVPVVTLATTDQGSARVTGEGTGLDSRRPGWLIELLRLAADKAGVRFDFRRMTWTQALDQVRTGEADGAFNSSFRPERAVYGVYPTKAGELDTSRATLNYTYWLYTRTGSPVTWDGVSFGNLTKPVGAERSAAVVPELKKRGAEVTESETYEEMLRLLAEGRVDAVAGFEGNVDIFLRTAPQHYRSVTRHPVPLVRKTGYLMFSKVFYAGNRALAERIWDAVGEVWASPMATEIRRSYE